MAKALKVPINAEGIVTVSCPSCRDYWPASVAFYRNFHPLIAVECDCGEWFEIRVSNRKFNRQDVNICGLYTPSNSERKLDLTVENLSVSGLAFRKVQADFLQVGDEFDLSFQLDHSGQHNIHTRAILRWVNQCIAGAEFHVDQDVELVLCDYLQQVRVNSGALVSQSFAIFRPYSVGFCNFIRKKKPAIGHI